MTNVRWAAVATLAAVLGGGALAQAQHQHGAPAAKPAAEPSGSKRVTMEDLHRGGGVPPGWRFSWPAGDAARGREVFAKLECYQCHEVKSEKFPPVTPDPTRRGPELSGMGAHHPAEYFAESIINPNAVIVLGPGHTGPDGQSIMPDFRDSLTLAETIDLVAFIRSLGGGNSAGDHAHHGAASPAREQTAGSYRVRLAFHAPGQGGDHAHHQHGAAKPAPAGHLGVLVNDLTTGEPVPYLPVTVTIHTDRAAPRVVRLSPMLGGKGFHYGADVTLPAATKKITVALGKPTLRLMPGPAARFSRGAEVSFDWGK
ncbi:MAG TPA: c-type cytochrome [Patescibacteria group bacterium]|nr:c-type cytochrome [Patescibacteria group bacterium]